MTTIAVIAHSRKQLGGGLPELREVLARSGVTDPLWYEVPKSKKAPKRAREAVGAGADLVFVWGGDGMVQRCIDALADTNATIAIVPAGTANLLATNLEIPQDIEAAVDIGLHGARRKLDTGTVNGEHFAVMAGEGFDALMIRGANRELKERAGRLAYVLSGAKYLRTPRVRTKIKVDGKKWFDGKAGCVLIGNVSKVFGGITAFDNASPDDGRLELGVVTADGALQWTRALGRTAFGRAENSPFVRTTQGREFDIKLARKTPYELDGGDRPPVKRLKVAVQPGTIAICVPDPLPSTLTAR